MRSRFHPRLSESAYRVRILAGLGLALGLLTIAVRLNWYAEPERVGWRIQKGDMPLPIEMPETPPTDQPEPEPPEDAGSQADLTQPPVASDLTSSGPEGKNSGIRSIAPLEEVVLQFAETMPEIRGGLGRFYLGIEYPAAAIDQGIEGRLILDFIVRKDGTPANVRVQRSLHPLCDSAAVRALRRTLFIPGEQNGEPVAIRMRLPVRFELVDPAPKPDSTAAGTDI